jgi:hypothetical protein
MGDLIAEVLTLVEARMPEAGAAEELALVRTDRPGGSDAVSGAAASA